MFEVMKYQEIILTLICGVTVGFVLSLTGGGGSILAVPLLMNVVGIESTHIAIGTSAIAVAVNAIMSLGLHARKSVIKWRCAIMFTISGILGALVGSILSKSLDGKKLIALFGILMIVVGVSMIRSKKGDGHPDVQLTRNSAGVLAPRLIGLGLLTGIASGFFGIGGGFLVVPALIYATDMPLPIAISSSLVAVAAFGMTTATSYAFSGFVNWPVALVFIIGGAGGSLIGMRAVIRLEHQKKILSKIFGVVVIIIGLYVLFEGIQNFHLL